MRKMGILAIVGGLILGGAVPSSEAREKPINVFGNFGLMLNGFIIPNDLVLGAQVDVHLGKLLMVSPEFAVWSNHYRFATVTLAPALLVNLKLGRIFVGGGFTAMKGGGYGGNGYYAGDWQWHEKWATRPKFNLGYRARHFKLTLSGTPIDDGIAGVLSAGIGF
jgi:hypothetical protein